MDAWEAEAISAKLDNILIKASQWFESADIQAIDDILLSSRKKTKVETKPELVTVGKETSNHKWTMQQSMDLVFNSSGPVTIQNFGFR